MSSRTTNPIISLVKRNQTVSFFVLTYALCWGVGAALNGTPVIAPDGLFLSGILITALLVAAITGGRKELADLGRRLILWRVAPVWYGVVVVLPLAIVVLSVALIPVFGGEPLDWSQRPAISTTMVTLLVFIFLPIGAPFAEEVAWRGVALPRLLAQHSALRASLLLGAVWTLWHLPVILADPALRVPVPFLLSVLPLSVLFTWLSGNTRGSILFAVLFHAIYDLALGFMAAMIASEDFALMWWLLFAIQSLFAVFVTLLAAWRQESSFETHKPRLEKKDIKMNRPVIVGVSGLVAALAIATSVWLARPEPTSVAPVLPAEELQALIDRQAEIVPGIVLRVETVDGQIWAGAAGIASLDGTPMSPSTRQPIFSVSKMAVAATVLSLAEDGILALNDPVSRWVGPAVTAELDNPEAITIRQLLTQTSGLRDYWDDAFIEMVVADTTREWRPEELIAHAAREPAAAVPDDGRAHYSNTNFTLLGLIIEEAEGAPLANVLRERVLAPLGMTETASWEEGILRPDASGFLLVGGELVDLTGVDLSMFWSAGGLVASARDVALLTRGIFTGAILTNDTLVSLMTTFAPLDGEEDFDYGFGVERITLSGETFLGHLGDGPGYGALSLYNPRSGTSVVMLVNTGTEDLLRTFVEVASLLRH